MTHVHHTSDENNRIADRVAYKLDKTTVEGRQPMPRARRWSMGVFAFTFLIAAIIIAVVGYLFDEWLGLIIGVGLTLLIFLVFGWPVIGAMTMRMREETQAMRQTEEEMHPEDKPKPRVIKDVKA